ncbi:MAG: ribosome biogenesis GTP-binding protein YihA/YsxC, partial [bacterium]
MRVEFVTSAADLGGRPELVLPEFAFVGRSNCGKSSLINHFLGRQRIAKISGQPGKTRLLNYFLVDDRYYVVDLPGYGFAKVSKQQRAAWSRLIRAYLAVDDRPLAVFHLLDVRRRPSADDVEMATWLRAAGLPQAIAVTKIDKESGNRRPVRYKEIISVLQPPAETPFLPTSASE